ncbi:TPA: hypothetical protein ACH3X1_006065 [Trebouxia sp. C0004]
MRKVGMSIAFCSLSPKFVKYCIPIKLRPIRVVTFSPNRKMVSSSAATATPVAATKDYQSLCDKLREISTLGGISGLLQWDEAVMMPAGAAESRGKQKSVLAGVVYEKETSAELGHLLKTLKAQSSGLDPVQAAVVRDAHRQFVRNTAITKEMAQRRAELESEGYVKWVKARDAADFSQFAPVLQEWVELLKKYATAIDSSRPMYDVLLDDYEKGMTSARLDEVFAEVREGLVPLIKEIKAKGTPPDSSLLQGTFDTKAQAALCNAIAVDLGFNLEQGRLDVSVHPFTGGAHPTDVRMTTRFKEHDLTEGLTGAIHETGHSLYEQGRNLGQDGLPVNEALSLGVHESQSLLWERMVALSQPFAHYLLPKLQQHFPDLAEKLTPETLYGAINVIREPSMIRVEADEVTYPLHIILRYELEQQLLAGDIRVEDVPRLWNEKMTECLGCTPKDDAQGVLQDVHWSAGILGYFPTYSLGAMYACQIYQTACKEIPHLEKEIAAGNFKPLRNWLKEKIHQVGSLHPNGDELMKAVTGSPLDPSVFLNYLRAKYTALYKL